MIVINIIIIIIVIIIINYIILILYTWYDTKRTEKITRLRASKAKFGNVVRNSILPCLPQYRVYHKTRTVRSAFNMKFLLNILC